MHFNRAPQWLYDPLHHPRKPAMPIERPTFHESWHRVTDLRPRLRPGTRTIRQTSRGRVWHIVEDATGSQYFRMNDSAWRFVGLLDGRATVSDAWTRCQEHLGDDAPTQGEAIQLLGQLYSSNLLQADVSGDAATMFRRQKQRVAREMRSYLLSLLFLRIPIWDPDAFLTRWTPLVAWLFTPIGFGLWLVLLGVGAFHLIGHQSQLVSGLSGVLAPGNLLWLYLVYAGIKGVHELGHAFACKAFGRRTGDPSGAAGQVHTIGLMFLIFMPVPYVDASSSWLLKNKLHRIIVAAAGIIVELAVASVAAVVWSRTAEGSLIHNLAYNAMILAGVSTILFNGNPLMRYDGYYIFADLIEIPNLAQRSQAYLNYLVKRYAWGITRAVSSAYTVGERLWLFTYQITSGVYRLLVYTAITLFILDQRFVLGGVLILIVVLAWVLLPFGRFVRYLAADPELARQRPRALAVTALVALVAGTIVLFIPFPDHARIEGVVEPRRFENIHAASDGLIRFAAPSGQTVSPDSGPLLRAESKDLEQKQTILEAESRRLAIARRLAIEKDPAEAQRLEDQIEAVKDQMRWTNESLAALTVSSSVTGTWISPNSHERVGTWMKRGDAIGVVADLSELDIRASATQQLAAAIISEAGPRAEVRAKSRPSQFATGRIQMVVPAGSDSMPSPALGFGAGGTIETKQTSDNTPRSAELTFEVRITLDDPAGFLPGQRVIARLDLPHKTLAAQAWHAVVQTLQERFRL